MSAFDTGKKTIVPGEIPGQKDVGWLSYKGKPVWNNGAEFSAGATFDSIADVPAGIVGPVWVGGEQYVIKPGNSVLASSDSYLFNREPGYALIGDSTFGLNNGGSGSCTISTTEGNTTATVTMSSHGVTVGQAVVIGAFELDEVNGYHICDTYSSSSIFTIELPAPASATVVSGGAVLTVQARILDQDPVAYANAKAGSPLFYLGNYAIGGARTSALSGQLDVALNPSNNPYGLVPSVVFCSAGINSVNNDIDASTIIDELIAARIKAESVGAFWVQFAMWPLGNGHANFTVARMQVARTVNSYFRELAKTDKSFVFIDTQTLCVDLDTQYGEWKSGYSTDHIHPLKPAGIAVANNIAGLFLTKCVCPIERSLVSVFGDNSLTGTDGVASGTGASGDVATGFTLAAAGGGSQTVVGSKGIAASGNGESQRILLTSAAANDSAEFYIDKLTNVTAGKWYVTRATLTLTGSGVTRALQVGAQIIKTAATIYSVLESTAKPDEQLVTLTLESPPIFAATDSTRFRWRVFVRGDAAGAVTIDVSDVDILEIQ